MSCVDKASILGEGAYWNQEMTRNGVLTAIHACATILDSSLFTVNSWIALDKEVVEYGEDESYEKRVEDLTDFGRNGEYYWPKTGLQICST